MKNMWLILFPILWSTIYCYSDEERKRDANDLVSSWIDTGFRHLLVGYEGDLFWYTDQIGPSCQLLVRHIYEEFEREIEIKNDPYIEEERQKRQKHDSCCRSNFDCDLRKMAELNITDTCTSNIRHCDCESEFFECIKKLSDNGVDSYAHVYSIYTKKCYAEDYPIEKCIKYQYFYKHNKVFDQIPVIGLKRSVRCLEYKKDTSKAKTIQNFDMPFIISDGDSYEILDPSKLWEEYYGKYLYLYNQ